MHLKMNSKGSGEYGWCVRMYPRHIEKSLHLVGAQQVKFAELNHLFCLWTCSSLIFTIIALIQEESGFSILMDSARTC